MREGWCKRKIEEIATITMGQSPSGNSINETEGVEFHQGKIFFGEKYINESHFYTSEPIRIAEPNSLLLCVRAPIGVVNMTARKICIGRGLCSIKANDSIHSNFLYYALRSQKDYFNKNATGSTFLAISSNVVKDTQISFPSKDKQIQIASELDKISEMISKYDEQLKELDKLSQSIFYEMFGDPVENEKGWEVKIISDVSTYFNGVAHEQDIDDDGEFTLINSKFISTNGKVQKRTNKQHFPLLKNDLTMVLSDVPNGKALAKCYLVNEDNKYSLNQRICCFRGYEGAPLFFKYVVNRHQYFLSFNDGKGQTNLRKGDVEKMPIILPPLPLQQSFARKIEAIEAMKSKVREAKKEAETLLAARMQYWFE